MTAPTKSDLAAAFKRVWPLIERAAERTQSCKMQYGTDIEFPRIVAAHDNMIDDARRCADHPDVQKIVKAMEKDT